MEQSLNLESGYHIIHSLSIDGNVPGVIGFYDAYHNIILQEIEKNNIKGVNGLIRWIDVAGYYPNNKSLYKHALLYGSFEMFLMIYYICIFWCNDDDNHEYLDYNYLQKYHMDNVKSCFLQKMNNKFGKLKPSIDEEAMEAAGTYEEDLVELEIIEFENLSIIICLNMVLI